MSDEILLRASGSGALTTTKRGTGVTKTLLALIKKHETKILAGGTLTAPQAKELKDAKARRDAPAELSDTAKAFIRKTWLLKEKGFYKEIKSKYLDKGIYGEEDGITLITDIDKQFYVKNTKRINKGNLTGECDINSVINGVRVIQDIKCCWDAETFINSEIDNLYEWQGRIYMHLYDADEFWLRYCLVDCPPHIVVKEKEYKWRQYFSDSMSDEEQHQLEEKLKPIYDQIDRNLVYSTSSKYTKEERVKTFKITRDDVKFKELLDKIPHALKYYNSLTLNGANV